MSQRVLLVISDQAANRMRSAGLDAPRRDYAEIQKLLHADILDYDSVQQSRPARLMRRLLGAAATQAWLAFRRRARYDAIYSDGEHVGIPLAWLLRHAGRRPRHVTIGHLLDTPLKRLLMRLLRPQPGLDRVFVHSTRQQQAAVEHLGFRSEQIALVPYQADDAFWFSSHAATVGREICAVGLEYRDYATLIAAMSGLEADLTIVAGSPWSTHSALSSQTPLPENINLVSSLLEYSQLRDLYDRARMVVVPLLPAANQAGITTILEAMAMSLPVIVTANMGQRDVIRGRLVTAQGAGTDSIGGPAVFGMDGALCEAETGLYVPPGDPAALRTAIRYLLDHPDDAARMGAAGRAVVEAAMNLDTFCRRVSEDLLLDVESRSEVESDYSHSRAAAASAGSR